MRTSGFTLIEAVIVVAFLAVILGLGVFASQELYRRQGLEYEAETLAVLLIRARDYSLTGLAGAPHTVCLTNEGASFALIDASDSAEVTPRQKAITIEGLSNCEDGGIAFALLSATTTGAEITFREGERTATIEVNREGMISW